MSLKSSTNTEVNTYELVLEISPEAFDKAVNAVYNRQKANIAVKGFRKGKATRKIIENAYGEGVFYDDALNAILPYRDPWRSNGRRRWRSCRCPTRPAWPAGRPGSPCRSAGRYHGHR